jgi:hypothetical protein
MNVKSPNNTSKWQMGFNSAFKGLKTYIVMILSRSILLVMRNCLDKIEEKIRTHILCAVIFPPPPANRALYGIMWKNAVEPDRQQMSI